jgi:tetratricopeptide (TPR) repeat protein
VGYVGDAQCAGCHPAIAQTYRKHSMGQSLAPITEVAGQQDYGTAAHNPFTALEAEFLVKRQGQGVFHQETRRDAKGKVVLEHKAEVAYAIGSGAHAISYLIQRGDYLFQSPITWFSQKKRWDLSPGFETRHDRFERTVAAECLFCHCNQVEPVEGTINRYREPLFRGHAIGCERCHGPGGLHVQDPGLIDGCDPTIVNPAHLQPELREAVCEQCHLEGANRVLRRGRAPFDFRPGLPLQLFWTTFVKSGGDDSHEVVSHVEQMHLSQCFQKSAGKMGCITCHDPHALPKPAVKVSYYRSACLKCHRENQCSLPAGERQAKNGDDCNGCHLPRRVSSDVSHVAITDHRILRKPDSPSSGKRPTSRYPLVPFHRGPDGPGEREVARDLGIALIEKARQEGGNGRAGELALPLLNAALQEDASDVAALEARGYALWLLRRPREALAAAETVLNREPQREIALVDAATAAEAVGRNEAALAYWRRAVEVNPWTSRYRFQRANLLAVRGEWEAAAEECRTVLRNNPGNVEARLLLVAYHVQRGDRDRARAEFEAVLALHPPEPDKLRAWFAEKMR